MCGRSGELSALKANFEYVERVYSKQHHRGSDHKDLFISDDRKVVLGMTRLSIFDIDDGYQPMSIDNGKYSIGFNGEMFNFLNPRHHQIWLNKEIL